MHPISRILLVEGRESISSIAQWAAAAVSSGSPVPAPAQCGEAATSPATAPAQATEASTAQAAVVVAVVVGHGVKGGELVCGSRRESECECRHLYKEAYIL